ncbi:hypothetical protein R6U77_15545 [Lysinibacillus louembei]|uniref:Uncharacterized protein n=1 Tax=Lysinibacillus louembei TaxID=1470088 RepID=A0ABZ0RVJ3_9BACI|nr:hypothetical protein [Lysinibacillus louembei]WPK11287.1 hypothetical protein R6U77_15545 [Lysinibacillus louembei]
MKKYLPSAIFVAVIYTIIEFSIGILGFGKYIVVLRGYFIGAGIIVLFKVKEDTIRFYLLLLFESVLSLFIFLFCFFVLLATFNINIISIYFEDLLSIIYNDLDDSMANFIIFIVILNLWITYYVFKYARIIIISLIERWFGDKVFFKSFSSSFNCKKMLNRYTIAIVVFGFIPIVCSNILLMEEVSDVIERVSICILLACVVPYINYLIESE